MTIYKAQVTLYITVPDDCQDPDSFVGDALSTQLSENGIHNPESEIADWHYRLAPGTPSGYVWPEPATEEDLLETELLGGSDRDHVDDGELDGLARLGDEHAAMVIRGQR